MVAFAFILLLFVTTGFAHPSLDPYTSPIIEHGPAMRRIGIQLPDGSRVGVCHAVEWSVTFPQFNRLKRSPFSTCVAGRNTDQLDCILKTPDFSCSQTEQLCKLLGAVHYSVDSYCLPRFRIMARSGFFFNRPIGYCVGELPRPSNTVIKKTYATFTYLKDGGLVVKREKDPQYASTPFLQLARSECSERSTRGTLVSSLDKSVVTNGANAIKIL